MQYVKRNLESIRSQFGIEVETGVSTVEQSGDQITGTWLSEPKIVSIGSLRPVAVQLLNMTMRSNPDPEIALRFTKKFGPLTTPYRPCSSFRFSTQDWIVEVSRLQETWVRVSHAIRNALPVNVVTGGGDYFNFDAKQLTFRTRTLGLFVTLEVASVPASLLRKCANWPRLGEAPRLDFCRSPYFIAGDKREKYCSEACAQTAQRRSKLKWWNENRKGDNDGTEKAR